jgi:hypothetical protein
MDKDAESLFNRRFLAYFAVGLTLCGMAYLVAITFVPIPAPNVRFADTILGFIIGTLVAAPIAFYYGSSKSSQANAQALRELVPQHGDKLASMLPPPVDDPDRNPADPRPLP